MGQLDPDGTFVSLDYSRAQAGATAAAHLYRKEGSVTLEGAGADCSRISGSAPVTGSVLVNCPLVSCLVPFTPVLQPLALGESRDVSVIALGIVPAPAIVPEKWTLTRDPDAAKRAVQHKAARGNASRGVGMKLDDAGILEVISDGDMEPSETSREGH